LLSYHAPLGSSEGNHTRHDPDVRAIFQKVEPGIQSGVAAVHVGHVLCPTYPANAPYAGYVVQVGLNAVLASGLVQKQFWPWIQERAL